MNGYTPHSGGHHNNSVLPSSRAYTIPREPVKFDLGALEKVCLLDLDDFKEYGYQYGKGEERYYYADHGSNILAVAHLDSVSQYKHFVRAKVADEVIVYNAQLDDRLGAYIILELLPKLGIQCDILLTNGEEVGRSTAKHFEPPADKVYDWMFSFDRMGRDVVMYQYETPKYAQLLRESDFIVAKGSFSDIGALGFLGCAGFNVGCGYADYHSKLAHVKLSDTAYMIQSFVHFYNAHHEEHLAYEPTSSSFKGTGYSGPSRGEWDYGDDWGGERFLAGSRASRHDDGKEYCAMHHGRVETEDYVYGEACCYECYRKALVATAKMCRDDLVDAKLEENADATP